MQKNKFITEVINIINEKKQFYFGYAIFLILSTILLFLFTNAEITLWFNVKHTIFWNYFFIFFTTLGDGALFGILIFLAGIYRIKYLINGLIFYIAPNIITHIIKVAYNHPRPLGYFGPDILNRIEGVELYKNFSFPSGHTTSGFAIFMFLLFLTKNKNLAILYLISAVLVGLSRVYLLQHFYIDIYVASMISVVISTIVYYYLENNQKLKNSNWYNFSFYNKIIKKNVSRETI